MFWRSVRGLLQTEPRLSWAVTMWNKTFCDSAEVIIFNLLLRPKKSVSDVQLCICIRGIICGSGSYSGAEYQVLRKWLLYLRGKFLGTGKAVLHSLLTSEASALSKQLVPTWSRAVLAWVMPKMPTHDLCVQQPCCLQWALAPISGTFVWFCDRNVSDSGSSHVQEWWS